MTTSDTRLSFGLTLPQRGMLFGAITGPELVNLGRRADENPLFDSVWVGDNLFTKPRPDSLTLLGGLATATTRVKLAVGCMASFPVRDPIVFAYQWATLDLLSAGRMLLAACTGIISGGASEDEGRPWGVKDGQRASRMAENMEICRALWTGEETSFAGRYTNFEGLTLQPRPVQDPCPIWIAANPSPQRPEVMTNALRRVARKADGWMTVQLFPDAFGILWSRLTELLVEEGKDPAVYPNIAYHNININEDGEAGLAESKRFLDAYYGPVFSLPMVQAWTALGSPQECIAHLRALRDAGAKAVTLRITAWDQAGQYRRLVEEVLPNV